jgi:hypothetical protein
MFLFFILTIKYYIVITKKIYSFFFNWETPKEMKKKNPITSNMINITVFIEIIEFVSFYTCIQPNF